MAVGPSPLSRREFALGLVYDVTYGGCQGADPRLGNGGDMGQAKIGILTGGGDVPGLNSVIKSAVYRSRELGREVIGIRRGWQGLTHMQGPQDPNYIRPLTRDNTRTIDRTGGTVLHTSRTNPAAMRTAKLPPHLPASELKGMQTGEDSYDLTPVALRNLEAMGVGILIAIGGDDTLSYASRLHGVGFPVIGIPKTMDNDVHGTEYCIGFSTAITRAKQMINQQRTTVGSHERIGVFRIFGRNSGFTALYTGYVTSTRCLIPEHPFELDHLCDLLREDKGNNPSGYALVVISEGAVWKGENIQKYGEADAFGHRKKVNIGEILADEIKRRTKSETMASDLTYALRSGEPDSLDHLIAVTFANIALDLVSEGISGRMVCIQGGCYSHTQIPGPGERRVDVARLYNTQRYRPNYANKLGAPMLLTQVGMG